MKTISKDTERVIASFCAIYNVNLAVFDTGSDIGVFDMGLRNLLFERTQSNLIMDYVSSVKDDVLLFQSDQFYCRYIIFKLPNTSKTICIGPYLEFHISSEEMKKVFERFLSNRNNLLNEIVSLYRRIPVIMDVDAFHRFFIEILDFNTTALTPANAYTFPFDNHFEASTAQLVNRHDENLENFIKERYGIERLFLNEVSLGNTKEALLHYHKLKQAASEYTNVDLPMGTNRIYLMSINTMLRLTASQANVHPIYIDRISGVFTRRIIDAKSKISFSFVERMIEEYCELINQYSYRGLSELVQNVSQTINYNLKHSYSLSDLSQKFNVSPSHLSAKFKAEHGITITEYTNTKRLFLSRQLLIDTDIPINEIAEKCGFEDPNYFSRLFKKTLHISPSEYRKNKSL